MPDGPSASAFRRRSTIAHALAAFALLSCSALIFFPPTRFNLYPQCPVHKYLGLLCPGCGSTHALAALLRGHLVEALDQNALFVLLLPFALAAAVRAYFRAVRPGDFRWPRMPTPALTAMLVAAAIFMAMRNL
jgi:hypothetical protein